MSNDNDVDSSDLENSQDNNQNEENNESINYEIQEKRFCFAYPISIDEV